VSDQLNDGVFVYDRQGNYLYTYCDASDGLNNVRGIDFRNGHLFVTSGDDYVAEFDAPHNRLPDFINDSSDPFDIYFLQDGRSLLCDIQGTTDNVRLYDLDGNLIQQLFSVSFPEQCQSDALNADNYLSASFSGDTVHRFLLDGTIVDTTPWDSGRGVYRLGNGNYLVTSGSGVFEIEPVTGTIISQKNTGSARFIEITKLPGGGGVDFGYIIGTVTDLASGSPIEGAEVSAGFYSTVTGPDGTYELELYPNTYDVTAEALYHNPQTVNNIEVLGLDTTVVDFALTAPIIGVDTTPITATMNIGDTATFVRSVSNTGNGNLDFSIGISYGPGIGDGIGIEKVIHLDNVSTPSAEVASTHIKRDDLPVVLDFGDTLGFFDSQLETGDDGCLGMEFADGYFWVTGRNAAGGDIHKIHKFNPDGSWVASYDQGTSSLWGWRDMTWDGSFLYASDSGVLDQIDISSGDPVVTGVTIPGPENPNRGLAYDPSTDHFWTANFSSMIYEFDRSGTIINSYSNGYAIYGLAWDDVSEGGPYLWVYSQDGSPTIQISQFDPVAGTYTGLVLQGVLPPGYTDALAGGAAFTTEWDQSLGVLFTMNQGTPTDFVLGYEITPYSTWLFVDPTSGVVEPAGSIDLNILVDLTGPDIVSDTTYEANISVNNNSPDTPVIPVTVIVGGGTGCDYVVGDINGSGSLNGLDVTYAVAYFKGGPPPPFECDCPPHGTWYVAGDANASCSFNGLDVTYLVSYFKGGSSPIPCADCPPSG
jgi:hypothetical protein